VVGVGVVVLASVWHISIMRRFFLPCLFLCAAACHSEDPRQAQAARDRGNVDAVARAARGASQLASTGRWGQSQLTQRLIDAGLAPRPDDSLPTHPDYKVKPVAYRLGGAHLLAWIYSDSMARRAVSATIDTLTAFPKAEASAAWAALPEFVVQNNLIAVILGGSDRQRERIRLAIEAGLAAPPRSPAR
jgi:hypothetical protein